MIKTVSNFLWAFGIASAFTIGLGALTMAQAGLPVGLWLRNPAAWVIGLGLAMLVARFPPPRLAVLGVAVALLALTFAMPGQSGVHRWIGIGPLQINAAALVLPMVIAGLRPNWTTVVASIALAILIYLQPDASQLTALSVALVIFSTVYRQKWMIILPSLIFCGAIATWKGINLLPPVAHVEGIIDMAWMQTPLLAIGIVVALAATALCPLLHLKTAERRHQALALTIYFAVSAVAVVTGYFPVPLAGYGVSFVIGWWLGAGLLASRPANEKVET